MEENKNYDISNITEEEEQSSFSFASLYATFILNWKWFLLSLIICLGVAAAYLRYETPIYQTTAQILIKEPEKGSSYRNNTLRNTLATGIVNNNEGILNEIEILKSQRLSEQVVKDLKLYVNYKRHGRVNDKTDAEVPPGIDKDKCRDYHVHIEPERIAERRKCDDRRDNFSKEGCR